MSLEDSIIAALRKHPAGLPREALQRAVRSRDEAWKFRRLLALLESRGLLHGTGSARARRYHAGPAPVRPAPSAADRDPVGPPSTVAAARPTPVMTPGSHLFSTDSERVIDLVTRPISQRTPCSYDRSLLDHYRPNRTHYLRAEDRRRLAQLGATPDSDQPAGTWARHVFERLLIDLSWNSSRLEGNTYSLLDTERLFRDRHGPEGYQVHEVQMLLNHKQAIEYLVEEAPALQLTPRTVRALHGLLADNLLADPADEGRLRRAAVGIHDSVFVPLAVPQQIEELFDLTLATAAAIDDAFEQSFFLLVHLPYLQPFADVNKRTSRLAANLPLLRRNLQPLSFVDVPREAYTLATLAVYEQRRIEPLRDLYLWAYQRSAERYRAIVKSMGEPDPFRLKHRDALRETVRTIVRELPAPDRIAPRVAALARQFAPEEDQLRFEAVAHAELRNLNDGTFYRYGLRPSEFERWNTRDRGRVG